MRIWSSLLPQLQCVCPSSYSLDIQTRVNPLPLVIFIISCKRERVIPMTQVKCNKKIKTITVAFGRCSFVTNHVDFSSVPCELIKIIYLLCIFQHRLTHVFFYIYIPENQCLFCDGFLFSIVLSCTRLGYRMVSYVLCHKTNLISLQYLAS